MQMSQSTCYAISDKWRFLCGHYIAVDSVRLDTVLIALSTLLLSTFLYGRHWQSTTRPRLGKLSDSAYGYGYAGHGSTTGYGYGLCLWLRPTPTAYAYAGLCLRPTPTAYAYGLRHTPTRAGVNSVFAIQFQFQFR